jgi:ribosomal 50S subunit-recycling heat shock protein
MRLDKYLKVSRLIKRRTVANDACDGQHITVNGRTAKASYDVKVGDVIEIAFGQRTVKVEVLAVTENAKKDDAAAMSPNDARKKPPLRMFGAAVLPYVRSYIL